MREKFANYIVNKNKDKYNYSEERLEVINYSLQCMYTFVTKLVVIVVASILLGVWRETLILMAFYTPLRLYACGLHANTNLQCWIISSFMFLIVPYVLKVIELSVAPLLIISVVSTILFAIYAPADSKKKPIVDKTYRFKKKLSTVTVSIVYILLIIFINNPYLSKLIVGAQLLQAIYILPITYSLFKQTYNNGKLYYKNGLNN